MIMPTNENPIVIINDDCLKILKELPDKSIDLILTDPPYGINADKGCQYHQLASSKKTIKNYNDEWNNETPCKEVFDEILRIGKKVIIFGGNFFIDKLPFKSSWIIWDKIGPMKSVDFLSDVELAWTNLNRNISKKYTVIQKGFIAEERERDFIQLKNQLNYLEKLLKIILKKEIL